MNLPIISGLCLVAVLGGCSVTELDSTDAQSSGEQKSREALESGDSVSSILVDGNYHSVTVPAEVAKMGSVLRFEATAGDTLVVDVVPYNAAQAIASVRAELNSTETEGSAQAKDGCVSIEFTASASRTYFVFFRNDEEFETTYGIRISKKASGAAPSVSVPQTSFRHGWPTSITGEYSVEIGGTADGWHTVYAPGCPDEIAPSIYSFRGPSVSAFSCEIHLSQNTITCDGVGQLLPLELPISTDGSFSGSSLTSSERERSSVTGRLFPNGVVEIEEAKFVKCWVNGNNELKHAVLGLRGGNGVAKTL